MQRQGLEADLTSREQRGRMLTSGGSIIALKLEKAALSTVVSAVYVAMIGGYGSIK